MGTVKKYTVQHRSVGIPRGTVPLGELGDNETLHRTPQDCIIRTYAGIYCLERDIVIPGTQASGQECLDGPCTQR
ncbi:hypothetical protein Y1Q_0017253 [Alligator mississippiensis]|uniref:Uncharacterized protein n=1 Tax=Alligator mississippiensis TaxID=8496 RepID=A0A151NKW8_ALLMI|nr:hypothetical protein Y1Q_0017253 [Alligator mississippiensis]